MKKIILGILIIMGLVYFIFSYFFIDVQINKYADLETVKEQQAIKNGWVPSILPLTAYEITETHNIDTNELFGSFKYKEKDEASFIKHLTKDNDDVLLWGNFLFKIDTKLNLVKFRNKPSH